MEPPPSPAPRVGLLLGRLCLSIPTCTTPGPASVTSTLRHPSFSEKPSAERMAHPGREGGTELDTVSKTGNSTSSVSLPRLRFWEAVGVFLKKHNTPSQEFQQEKRGSPARLTCGAVLLGVHTAQPPTAQGWRRGEAGVGPAGSPGRGHWPRWAPRLAEQKHTHRRSGL